MNDRFELCNNLYDKMNDGLILYTSEWIIHAITWLLKPHPRAGIGPGPSHMHFF